MTADQHEVIVGIDSGSTGVKVAVYDFVADEIVEVLPYRRHRNEYDAVFREILKDLLERYYILTVNVTGSTGKVMAESWTSLARVAEVNAHARGIRHLNPEVDAVIDAGGSEIKFFKIASDGRTYDFAMNPECAAGSGSFLDQQAKRLIMEIDDASSPAVHFPSVGLEAIMEGRTVPISGRCSVFAKSDMIHQQQKGVPDSAIVGGLHESLVNNIRATVIQQRLKGFEGTLSFQGGLSQNESMVFCMSTQLGLEPDQLFVHKWGYAAGAIGAALEGPGRHFDPSDIQRKVEKIEVRPPFEPLVDDFAGGKPEVETTMYEITPGEKLRAYMGIDVGSVSTNVVLIEAGSGDTLAKSYVPTRGRPIEAVRDGIEQVLDYLAEKLELSNGGLEELCRQISDHVEILGLCTTGSGRFLVGHFMKADLMKNEITAQATGSIKMAERHGLEVDTIFEIGGQDSKYIKLNRDHGVRDYTMNKVCAAGCGSFLEEQAEKFGMSIKKEFAGLALQADHPADLGDRCTVFIESVLDAYAAMGETKENLVAGLAYSVAHNYLNRVVEGRDTEGAVFFQGGTAFNKAVVIAFQKILKKPVIVPPHNEVTGAIGAAHIIAGETNERLEAGEKVESSFEGFLQVLTKEYESDQMVCKGCANHCELQVVKVQEQDAKGKAFTRRIYYGDRCDQMNLSQGRKRRGPKLTWVDKRNDLLFESVPKPRNSNGVKVGFPRAMTAWSEYHAYFTQVFSSLGYEVVLGPKTAHRMVKRGAALSLADYCLPVRLGFGAIEALIEEHHPDYVFIPHMVDYPKKNGDTNSFACVWTQTFPVAAKETFDFQAMGTRLLDPVVEFRHGDGVCHSLRDYLAKHLGRSRQEVAEAMDRGLERLNEYRRAQRRMAEEAMEGVNQDNPAFVIIGRPYNSADPCISMDIAVKLERMGHQAFPMDFLPIEDEPIGRGHENMYWKNGERIISAFRYCKDRPWLIPVWVTNFSCGPDSFIRKQVEYLMEGMPYLELELDEHTADAGVITRIEAFHDSYRNTIDYARLRAEQRVSVPGAPDVSSHEYEAAHDDIYRPGALLVFSNMCDAAFPLAASFRARGIDAVVLPRTDHRTLALGKRYSSGKECVPFQSTLGDKLNFVMNVPRRYMRYAGEVETLERPLEPEQVIFFDPFAQGPCRFGMYNEGYKRVYERLGLPVKLLSSGAHNNYADVFTDSLDTFKFSVVTLDGILAADILLKTRHLVRPAAKDRSKAEEIYYRWMRRIVEIIEKPGNSLFRILGKRKAIRRALRDAAGDFGNVEQDPERECADIGMFGEIYVRSEQFINEYLIDKLEEYNIRTLLAPVNEWLQYVNQEALEDYWEEEDLLYGDGKGAWNSIRKIWNRRKLLDPRFRAWYIPYRLRTLSEPFLELWGDLHDPLIEETLASGSAHVPTQIRGELILSWGFAREVQHHRRFSGIVNIGPFGCMPSKVMSVLLQNREITKPVLDANYDGSMVNTRPLKIETFASQVWDYRRGAQGGAEETEPPGAFQEGDPLDKGQSTQVRR